MVASGPSCPCPSYLHIQLCFPSGPILKWFPEALTTTTQPQQFLSKNLLHRPLSWRWPHPFPLTQSSSTPTLKELAVSIDTFNRYQYFSLNKIRASKKITCQEFLLSIATPNKSTLWFQPPCTYLHPPFPHPEPRPRNTKTYLSVTNFLNLKPSQFSSSHYKQDSLITTSKISRFLLHL